MNINDVISDGGKYIKLKAGDEIAVQFGSDFFKKEGESNGQKFVAYEVPCLVGITEKVEKVWSASSNFFGMVNKRAVDAGVEFDKCMFKIKRLGEGTDTKYDIQVIQ